MREVGSSESGDPKKDMSAQSSGWRERTAHLSGQALRDALMACLQELDQREGKLLKEKEEFSKDKHLAVLAASFDEHLQKVATQRAEIQGVLDEQSS